MPFVNVLATMLNSSLPLTPPEWLEWAMIRDKAAFETIRAYGPTTMRAHAGASGRYDRLDDVARQYAFASGAWRAGFSRPRNTARSARRTHQPHPAETGG